MLLLRRRRLELQCSKLPCTILLLLKAVAFSSSTNVQAAAAATTVHRRLPRQRHGIELGTLAAIFPIAGHHRMESIFVLGEYHVGGAVDSCHALDHRHVLDATFGVFHHTTTAARRSTAESGVARVYRRSTKRRCCCVIDVPYHEMTNLFFFPMGN